MKIKKLKQKFYVIEYIHTHTHTDNIMGGLMRLMQKYKNHAINKNCVPDSSLLTVLNVKR